MVEPRRRMAVRRPLPPHRAEAALRHHAAVHRGLGREPDGDAAGEEGQHDQRDDQQRPGGDGEADARGYAVLVPGELGWGLVRRGGVAAGLRTGGGGGMGG